MTPFRLLVIALLTSLVFLHLDHLHRHSHRDLDARAAALERSVQVPAANLAIKCDSAPDYRLDLNVIEAHARAVAAYLRAEPTARAAAEEVSIVDVKRRTVERLLQAQPRFLQFRIRHRRTRDRAALEVRDVAAGSLGEILGFRRGDLITGIDGESPISSHGIPDLSLSLPGVIDFAVEREGKPMRILVLLH